MSIEDRQIIFLSQCIELTHRINRISNCRDKMMPLQGLCENAHKNAPLRSCKSSTGRIRQEPFSAIFEKGAFYVDQGSFAAVMALMIISAASPRVTGRPKRNSRSVL